MNNQKHADDIIFLFIAKSEEDLLTLLAIYGVHRKTKLWGSCFKRK